MTIAANSNIKPTPIETRRKRLFYQSGYRGTKELDILLGRFANAHLAELNNAELQDYETLLDVNETKLFQWLTKQETPPTEYQTPVWHKLMAFFETPNTPQADQ